jgi:hypothetical protein
MRIETNVKKQISQAAAEAASGPGCACLFFCGLEIVKFIVARLSRLSILFHIRYFQTNQRDV